MYYLFLLGTIMLLLVGCNTDNPKPPEAYVVPMQISNYAMDSIEVSSIINQTDMKVRHHVKGKDVYVEVIIPDFVFTSNKSENLTGEGYLNLYVNNNKIDEIHQAAFIVKSLPTGKHTVKIEVVHNNSKSYGIVHEMEVIIP